MGALLFLCSVMETVCFLRLLIEALFFVCPVIGGSIRVSVQSFEALVICVSRHLALYVCVPRQWRLYTFVC